MSTTINIKFPEYSHVVDDRWQTLAVNNAGNASKQAAVTALSQGIRAGLIAGKISAEPAVVDYYTDRLCNDGGLINNNVLLRTEGGIEIEFISARINVQKSNKIVSQSLVNRQGKVKELIQEDDYAVSISGNLIADRDKFPYRQLYQLNRILSEAKIIACASAYLDIFNISELAFRSANFNQDNLHYLNVMPFTLQFDSDRSYEFLVNES